VGALVSSGAGLASPAHAADEGIATPGVYEETSPDLSYTGTWRALSQQASSGGAIAHASGAAAASLSFVGSSVTWYGWKAPTAGIAEVYIDGKLHATVDNYASYIQPKTALHHAAGLGPGVHTIEIRSTGTKNPAATGKTIHLDYLEVGVAGPGTYEETALNVEYSGTWKPQASGSSSGNAINYAPGVATASLTFEGGNINWYTWKSATAGIADVYLDGVLQARIDNYSASTQYKVRAFTAQNLAPGTHTIEIRATGTKNGLATGRNVHLDSFVVGTPTPEPGDTYTSPTPPAATVTVNTAAQLHSALAAAGPGTAIQLAPGTYVGDFRLHASGTSDRPIWLFGPRSAVLRGASVDAGATLRASGAHLRISGFTGEKSMQGVMVTRGSDVTVSDMHIRDIGQEGLHFYNHTSDSRALNNLIERTGTANVAFGEGIYIGTSPERWGVVTEGEPDRSDRNVIAGNTIRTAGAESIEAKPGTSGGVIANNILEGHQPTSRAHAWVLVGGKGWTIAGNTGTKAVTNGYATVPFDEWGTGNTWSSNSGTVGASGWAFWFLNGALPGTVVTCDNNVVGADSGMTNLFCTP
jgi:hypothetical protein